MNFNFIQMFFNDDIATSQTFSKTPKVTEKLRNTPKKIS